MSDSTTEKFSIKVIAGSTREARFSETAAQWIANEVKKYDGVDVEILDLRDYEMPFFNAPVSPSFKEKPYEHEAVARFTHKIAEADAYIIVTPEYNHGTSAVLKNAIDWVYQEWNNKPVGFVSYGSVGGARAVEQLRLCAIEVQMAPIREAIHINGEQYFPAYFSGSEEEIQKMFATMTEKSTSMIEQLLWWTRTLKKGRV